MTIHADERFGMWALDYAAATEDNWRTEYRSLDLTCAVVDSLDDAVEHIARYGTGHTESVVTESMEVARRVVARVDAATVTVNTPTTFAQASANLIDPELAFSTPAAASPGTARPQRAHHHEVDRLADGPTLRTPLNTLGVERGQWTFRLLATRR